ncbi:MAG: zinc-ribbon domain-containing protein [Gemmatimonadota bacterium]|nr:zinc-ribbon domain-containing protein [Gemmatimonadota bacterium]
MAGDVRRHPLYGEIPLLRREYAGPDGRRHEWLEPDPLYRPPLPSGAIRGDPSRQVYCSALHTPKYFYLDERRACVECGAEFVFEAREQRYWYERLEFNLNSVAIRCPSCRATRRRAKEHGKQIGRARDATRGRPTDPTPYLDLAEGLVRQYQGSGGGNLEEAVWAAREARRLWPTGAEADFWEGLSHWLMGREEEGREWLRRFTAHPARVRRRYRPMVAEAKRLLGVG